MFVDYRTDLVEGSSKRAGDELEQEVTKKQKVDDVQETAEVDDDQEAAKIKELMEIVPDEEEVAIDAIPLATKPPTIVDWKIHKEGKKNYYQIIRADGSLKMYLVFSHMLKSFNMEDFETLWKLVKAKYGSTRPVEDLDLILLGDLKRMFEPHIEDRGKIVGIKSFLMLFGITTVLIDVNAAQSKLVLLENFNENYSKFNAAEGINAASEEVSTAELVSTAYVILGTPRQLMRENIASDNRMRGDRVAISASMICAVDVAVVKNIKEEPKFFRRKYLMYLSN
ncbi:hypothetical protein Tco_1056852 [Tanacetum coccineum]|uniref:Uncharacterized protein n=1 Tax=Tanacetum coccineum TaxID=301880 RepID=A0ABQ5H4B7_9ASTR